MSLLYAESVPVTAGISVQIPTVGAVLADEENYFRAVSLLTATPSAAAVALYDTGVDFREITAFELFCMFFSELQTLDVSLIFGKLALGGFRPALEGEKLVLRSDAATIDRAVHARIAEILRKIHGFEKEDKRPANAEAFSFYLERERVKQARAAKRPPKSRLESLIAALVNHDLFPYTYETARGISMYQLTASLRQIQRKENYNHVMAGVYAGTVDAKKMNFEQINWIGG